MIHRFLSLLILVLFLFVTVLTGCQSKYGAQKTTVNYYPQCYTPVAQLRKDENSVATSTATGAAGGALLGALIGGLATGKVEGALAGAVAGGAAGAVGGHAYGKSQAQKRDAEYMRTYMRQLGSEAAAMDRASAAATVAMQCYDKEFKRASQQFRAGQINRLEYEARYKEIRSGLEETAFILKSTMDTMSQRDAEYQRTLAGEFANAQPRVQPSKKPAVTVAQQSSSWKASRQKMESTNNQLEGRLVAYEKVYQADTM